jgi:hypothetical protein
MPPFLIICFTALAYSLFRNNTKDMARDWNDEVYQELARAIEKELKLNMENPKSFKMPEKGTFQCLNYFKLRHLFVYK